MCSECTTASGHNYTVNVRQRTGVYSECTTASGRIRQRAGVYMQSGRVQRKAARQLAQFLKLYLFDDLLTL